MRFKKVTSVVLAMALALSLPTITVNPAVVSAAENLMENESVRYASVASVDAFRDYIDNDGVYASQDTIETDWEGFTDVHKIVVDEAGTLLIAPLDENGYTNTCIYSNFALTSQLGEEIRSITSSRDKIAQVKVKAGTYYYRASRWNGFDPLTVTTYIGFIPDSGNGKGDNKYNMDADTATPVGDIPMLANANGLNEYIDNDGAYASQDTIETDWTGNSTVHSITVQEDGWIIAQPLCENEYIYWKLYSNKDLTSCIATAKTRPSTDEAPVTAYVKAGTYYYLGSRWNGFDPITFTSYVGFLPASSRISVQEIQYSDDNSYATVTLDYDRDYLKSFSSGMIRLAKGYVDIYDINNNDIWKTSTRENALEGAEIKITANGNYTVRIENSSDNYYCLAHFTVSDIKAAAVPEKPAAPKIITAKKNAKVIKGTADANLKITVKVGSKSYTTVSSSKGNWTVKLAKKLNKGNTIKAYATNSKSVKSGTTTYKVK